MADYPDPAHFIGGTVVHHRKTKPHPRDYFSTDEETLRELFRPLAEADARVIDDAATVARIRSKLAIQHEQRLMPVGPDA